MAEIKKTALFSKLTPLAYKALEAGVVACKLRGNPEVELAHWLDQLIRQGDSDLACIVRAYQLRPESLALDTAKAIEALPRGSSSISAFSSRIYFALEKAFLWSSIFFDATRIRSGHLLVALTKQAELQAILNKISKEFEKISGDDLADRFAEIVAASAEAAAVTNAPGAGAAPGEASGAIGPAELGRQEALRRFTVDLTARARKGEIDAVVGRDDEIRQCIDILMRRRQNNPILTGEAGVGKTAVVEGFAHRIVAGDVPPSLRNVTVRSLDIGLLQAGASMKGEFEQRLRSVIDEVQASAEPIILFIDEVHTLIGAGGAAGTGDAANLLKPALARGTLRTVAATTWKEYREYIEKDPALTRRFQTVKVEEPDEEKCILMMRGVVAAFERHHKVQVMDEAVSAAVRLSHRYIPARQLPDKAVSLLDTAAARVAVSLHAVPARLDDARRQLEALRREDEIVRKEALLGSDHAKRLALLAGEIEAASQRVTALEAHWNKERELVTRISDLRAQLVKIGTPTPAGGAPEPASGAAGEVPDREAVSCQLVGVQADLAAHQGESPLMFPRVDEQAVASVVSDWTGIPVGRMVRNEIGQILRLADTLERRVIGQRHALDIIARRIQTNRARLDNPNRPVGVFMLVGPSGTGKTETALSLAEALYGGEQNLISINMSEFKEKHTVSTLKGAPPGYVGYGEGGVLTEAVRRRPYSVVLLDEFEKAHSSLHEVFFQVFDKGWMEDGSGRYIDFKNSVIILTSNAAQEVIIKLCTGKTPETMPYPEALEQAMREPLTQIFPDALLNRLVVVPYYPLNSEMLHRIIRLQIGRLEQRVQANHAVPFTFTQELLGLIAQRCSELERGARMVDAVITGSLLPAIGREVLSRAAEGRAISRVHVDAKEGEFSVQFD